MTQPDNGREDRTALGSEALGTLLRRWREGTFGELLEDWRWILAHTKRYKWAVACYLVLGVASASLGLVSAVASKYAIDIITGYQPQKRQPLTAFRFPEKQYPNAEVIDLR